MFGFLKKKLSESVEKLTEKVKVPKDDLELKEKPSVAASKDDLELKEKPSVVAAEKKAAKAPKAVKPAKKPEPEEARKEEPEGKKKIEKKPEPEREIKPRKEPAKVVPEKPKEETRPEEKPEISKKEPAETQEPEEKKGFLSRFRKKVEEVVKEEPKPEPKAEVPEEPGEKKTGFRERISGRVLERKITEKDIDSLFDEMELGLMEANVALEVVDFLKKRMKDHLIQHQVKRGSTEEMIRNTFETVLKEIFDQGKIDLEGMLRKKKPLCLVFLGFNGSGKTTSIAKLAKYLTKNSHKVVMAAGDTFRAAAIDQLETHAKRLGVRMVKHDYGADSAAVVFDAVKHATSKGIDFVLADTAGRSHQDKNLMDELKKVIRVNKPDLKIMVIDSLTGNDVVEQAKQFDEAVGVDCMVFTKVDVNQKGGSLLSACHVIKKPILFIGTGQKYEDIELFDPEKFVKDLMSE
ncbi:MAG: signal recognition particle-docking protein FtsY [Candidatus Aenigmarchaeota archaeon]|nr:signal recognition particle-docking protein FtsY [Candidatus Aenigmarchaeota archaeon]